MSEIERVKVEGALDVFQTVKAARTQRPYMVASHVSREIQYVHTCYIAYTSWLYIWIWDTLNIYRFSVYHFSHYLQQGYVCMHVWYWFHIGYRLHDHLASAVCNTCDVT